MNVYILSDLWTPPLWLSYGSFILNVIVGIVSVMTLAHVRRESRASALTDVLSPMLSAYESLVAAAQSRRAAETLKRAYPDPKTAPDAVVEANNKIVEYGKQIEKARVAFRESERVLGARIFRFPDHLGKLLGNAKDRLSSIGTLLNNGRLDAADVAFGKFLEDYKTIRAVGRGWRLNDPFEGAAKIVRRWLPQKPDPGPPYGLTKERFQAVLDLVSKRFTTESKRRFTVHGPQKLVDNPALIGNDDVLEQLENEVFLVVFQDGDTELLTLAELMVFVHEIIVLSLHAAKAQRMVETMPDQPMELEVKSVLDINEIMKPEIVKVLLGKIEFSQVSADALSDGESTN